MKKFFLSAIALSVFILAVSFLAPSAASAAPSPKRAATPAAETYMVVKIGDDYKVLGSAHLKDEEKRLKDDYAQKMKEWHDLKKTDPQAPAPQKLVIKKIPKLNGYLTQTKAQEAADKLKEEEANKDEKPKDKR
jgi:hypothetical protein